MTHFHHDGPSERERVSVPLSMLPGVLRKYIQAVDGARAADVIDDAEALRLKVQARRSLITLPVYTLEEIGRGEGR